MRIVATSDTHFLFDNTLIPDGDVLIHAGDLMMNGTLQEWNSRVESLRAMPHKTKLLVPGNHDYFIEHYPKVAEDMLAEAGIELWGTKVDRMMRDVGGFNFLFLPYVTNLPSWAYNRGEEWLADFLSYITAPVDVVVSHAPMYGLLDAINPKAFRARDKEYVGCRAYARWFNQLLHQPKYWVCGHIHESYGTAELRGTKFMNVAMCNKKYEQANQAMVFDL